MSKQQHTPGPWSDNAHGSIRSANGWLVAEALHAGSRAEGIANALLIAASPGLLAACQAIIARVDAPGGTIRSIRGEDVAALRAAIAKAGGEA